MRTTILLISTLMLMSCTPWRGFLESEFTLAEDSPLPSWVDPLPEGYSRSNTKITLQYWSPPWDVNDAVLIVSSGATTILKKTGKSKRPEEWLTWSKNDRPSRRYPSFNLITIDGVTEVIEHKQMEPIFYISDQQTILDLMESDNR